MSIQHDRPSDEDADPWAEVAEHQEAWEMVVEEGGPFEEYARTLLEKLAEEGYR